MMRQLFIISFPFLLILTLIPRPSHSFHIISCTDSPSTVSSTSWKSSVPLLKTQITRSSSSSNNNSHESWYYEGVSPSTGGEVTLTYEDDLKKRGTDIKFYLEYLNESPRRALVDNVKSDLAGNSGPGTNLVLLPGDSSDNTGWRNGIFQVMFTSANEKLKLTAILKKPQRLYIRKLVLVQNPGAGTRSLTDLLRTKSCQELAEMQMIQTTTIRPGAAGPRGASTQRTTAASDCKNKSTQMGNGDTCPVCPECKCVCNCNCKDKDTC